MSRRSPELEIAGRRLPVSNLDKLMFPQTGFTKSDVIDYYVRVADALLPHLKDRPLTLKRYPDGVEGSFFYEKQCPIHRPDWVKTKRVASRNATGRVDYCVAADVPTLVWVANLATLELHTFLHRVSALGRPTAIAFDLDPGPPADIVDCLRVALWLRRILTDLGLDAYPKTSGSKGLQVYLPLNSPVTYERAKGFARSIAAILESEHPEVVVTRMEKARRRGRVFIDWSQNDAHKTTVCVYSLRARPIPAVSTPLTWNEVESALRRTNPLSFTPKQVLERVAADGDIFAPVLAQRQKLPATGKLVTLAP